MLKLAGFLSTAILASLIGCISSDCGDHCEKPKSIDPLQVEQARTSTDTVLAQASAHFGANLLGQLVESESEGESGQVNNLAFSPISAAFALGMATLGAEGKTQEEMLQALQWPGLQDTELVATLNRLKNSVELADSRLQVTTVNSAWIKQGFGVREEYRHLLASMRAEAAEVDFAIPTTSIRINDWVKTQTRGVIESIIDSGETLSGDLAIMLINATYFKGDWTRAFDPKATSPGVFHLTQSREPVSQGNGSTDENTPATVTVEYMHQSGVEFPYLKDHAMFTAVALPFGAGGMEMVFILPKEPYRIWEVSKNIAASPQMIDPSHFQPTKLDIALPKFHLQSDLDLIPTLELLGIQQAFTEAADFSGMAEAPLKIGKVKQKVDVRIDETGAEAAAVTRVDVVLTSFPSYPNFQADRPFLFVIRESRGLGYWLFAGLVANPSAKP